MTTGIKYCVYGYYILFLIYVLHIFVVFFNKENAFCLGCTFSKYD